MRHLATFALLGIFSVLPAVAQSAQTDSQTLESILVELRSIHEDVRLSQASQILLAELQIAQAAVEKATGRRDDQKMRMTQAQANQKNLSSQLARMEDSSSSTTTLDPVQKKRIADTQDNLKTMLAQQQIEEQARSSDLTDAENALRKAQEALNGVQNQLNDVMKKLQP
jgi:hypothetical protein